VGADTTAVALAVRKHAPRLGGLFLFLAVSIAVATVYGRYHYAADAVTGALVGVAAYNGLNFFKKERRNADSMLTLPRCCRAVEDNPVLSPAVIGRRKCFLAGPSKG